MKRIESGGMHVLVFSIVLGVCATAVFSVSAQDPAKNCCKVEDPNKVKHAKGSEPEAALKRCKEFGCWAHTFVLDDPGSSTSGGYQCGGAVGLEYTNLGDWSRPIRINTDSGFGGCSLQYAIIDPENKMNGAEVTMAFGYAGANTGECQGFLGSQIVPRTVEEVTFSKPIRIDTDNRTSYCNLTFAMTPKDGKDPRVQLRIRFESDDEGVDQCKNRSPAGSFHIVTPGHPVTLGLDTDNRYGGCQLSFQLSFGG